MRKGINLVEKNGMWKGDKVGIGPLHRWIERHKPKPKVCEKCKKNKPFDIANISGEYKRDINDFQWICRKCHMEEDGRLIRLQNSNRKFIFKYCKYCNKEFKLKRKEGKFCSKSCSCSYSNRKRYG